MNEQVQPEAHPLQLDPHKNTIISAFGRKGSGKTSLNRVIYQSYPYAKLCIDVNGEADPGPDAQRITNLSSKMTPKIDGEPYPNLHWIADPRSETFRDDLDRAVGMALYPQDQPCLVWCGEIGEFTRGSWTGPNLRTLLMQSRHYNCSALFDGPRPMDIDKLVIAQADYVAVFDMPDPADQERVAKVIGWPPRKFTEACEECWSQGEFFHLLWDAKRKQMYDCDPLPL